MAANELSLVPEPIRPAWLRIRHRLDRVGLADLVRPAKTRISLRKGSARWLKYDYDDSQWVFCAAIGDRMDDIDPQVLCVRTNKGTRMENGRAVYTGSAVDPLIPVLDRLVDIVMHDVLEA